MLSEEEKKHIIEKVQFENEIRQKLSIPSKPKRFSWLNNRISLLLIGSVITGILVPLFQYTQKTIEWKRQNQFANINYRLGMMRDCLKEFVYLSAYIAEAYERVTPFMNKAQLTPKLYAEFEQGYIEMQNARFRQNAKVTSLMIYFQDTIILKQLFRDYIKETSDYLRDLKRFVRIQYCISNPEQCTQKNANKKELNILRSKMDSFMAILNESYSKVIAKMKEDIGRFEDENENFRL